MSEIYCPACGDENVSQQMIINQEKPKADLKQSLQYVMNYALMGISTARQFKLMAPPLSMLVGGLVGGVIGYAAYYLQQDQVISSSSQQVKYQCLTCGHDFYR